jgi:hypothetical protein
MTRDSEIEDTTDAPPRGEAVRGPHAEEESEEHGEEFGELLRYTAGGYLGGLALGTALDALGYHHSAVGQWLVRTLAGEGESLLEGLFALRRRLADRSASLAEAYGWGKLGGMAVPWVIDWGSRMAGLDVYGIGGFYIPYVYAMADQIGAGVSGLVYFRRRNSGWGAAVAAYVRHPVMLTGLAIVLGVPLGLLTARLLGFSPTTQVLTALETIAANLCWLPPTVGWLRERRAGRARKPDAGRV